MRRLFLGAAFTMLLFPVVAVAQTNEAVQTIRGQVCDVASGEPMIGVKITVEKLQSLLWHAAHERCSRHRCRRL